MCVLGATSSGRLNQGWVRCEATRNHECLPKNEELCDGKEYNGLGMSQWRTTRTFSPDSICCGGISSVFVLSLSTPRAIDKTRGLASLYVFPLLGRSDQVTREGERTS